MAKADRGAVPQPTTAEQKYDILWIVPDKPANISTGRQQIAQRLKTRGHSVRLVADRTTALQQARQEYDILLGTTAWLGAVAPLSNAKIIVDYVDPIDQLQRSCGPVERTVSYALHESACRLADGILYVYDRVADEVASQSARSIQTSLGVPYERFATPPECVQKQASDLLTAHEVPETFAVYIGGLEPTYNIKTMLAAATSIETHLVIAGTGSQTDLVESYASQTANITYLGCVGHDVIPGILAKASAGVCLVDDPHTVKVLEYAAAGLSVVHIDGQAKSRYPAEMHWCQNKQASVSTAIETAVGDSTGTLTDFAKAHDYSRVVDDYERIMQQV